MTPTVTRELYSSSHNIDMLFLALGVQLSQDYLPRVPHHDPFTNPKFLRASYPTARNLPSNITIHHTWSHRVQAELGLIAMDPTSFQESVRTVCPSRPVCLAV